MAGIDIKRLNTFNIVPHTKDGKVYTLNADEDDDKMQYNAPTYIVQWPKPLNHENKKCIIVCPFCKTKNQFADNYIPQLKEIKDCIGCKRHLKVFSIIPLGDQKLQNMQNQYVVNNGGYHGS